MAVERAVLNGALEGGVLRRPKVRHGREFGACSFARWSRSCRRISSGDCAAALKSGERTID
jgi:hypothetical protein